MKETCGEPEIEPMFDKYQWRFWISGILTSITSLVGLVGNILSIITLMHKTMRNVFNNLMIVLCVADLLVIISSLPYSLKHLNLFRSIVDPLLHLSDCLSHVAVSISVFMTICITLERHFAVCSPLTYQVCL